MTTLLYQRQHRFLFAVALMGVLAPSAREVPPLPQLASVHQGVNPARSAGMAAVALQVYYVAHMRWLG